MDTPEDDRIPPDLSDLGQMLHATRAHADEDTIERLRRRAHAGGPRRPRRSPRRSLAVSLATLGAMLTLSGVATAAMFGSIPLLGKSSAPPLKSSASVTRAQAGSGPSPASFATKQRTSAPRGAVPRPAGPTAGVPVSSELRRGQLFGNAGNIQYRIRRIFCRILRSLGGPRLAQRFGCG